MKECRVLLAVLSFLVITCSTFGITITAQDIGGGQLQIGYQLDLGEVPLGFALQIELSDGAYISSPSDATASPYFPVYMDSAYTQELNNPGSYVYGGGTPISELYQPGELSSWPVSNFSICMAANFPAGPGSVGDFNGDMAADLQDLLIMSSEWLAAGGPLITDLDMDGQVDLRDYAIVGVPDWTGDLSNLITLQLHDSGSGFTDVTVIADLIRGGIVGEGGDINFFGMVQTTVVVPEPATLLLLGMGGLLIRKRK